MVRSQNTEGGEGSRMSEITERWEAERRGDKMRGKKILLRREERKKRERERKRNSSGTHWAEGRKL